MVLPRRAVPVLLVLALTATGCGDEHDEPAPDAWVADGPVLDTTALTWAIGETVHVGDTEIRTERPVEAYVVAGDSVWFVTVDDAGDALWRAGPDGVSETGAHAVDLLASPDGRYLSFVDDETGPRDDFDTPQAQTVVVDLTDGREVVRSADGMGDRGEDDLADLYEDAEFGNLGFADGVAWFDTADGERGYDVATGDPVTPRDRTGELYDELYRDGLPASPDGAWVLTARTMRNKLREVDTRRSVVPSTGFPAWSLTRWLEDGRAIGIGWDAPPDEFGMIDPATAGTLITCSVPDGECAPVPGATSTEPIRLPESLRGR